MPVNKVNYINSLYLLIKEHKTNEEIKAIIYQNYSIRLKKEDIESRRSNKKFKEKYVLKRNRGKDFLTEILDCLNTYTTPISKNKLQIILSRKNININLEEIREVLKNELLDFVEHNSSHDTYILKSKISNQQEANKTKKEAIVLTETDEKHNPQKFRSFNDLIFYEIGLIKKSFNGKDNVANIVLCTVEKMLKSCISSFNIPSKINEEAKREQIKNLILHKLDFLTTLTLILKFFKDHNNIAKSQLYNFLTVNHNRNLNIVDLDKLLKDELNFLISHNGIYFKVKDTSSLEKFLNEVSDEIKYYDLHLTQLLEKEEIVDKFVINDTSHTFSSTKIDVSANSATVTTPVLLNDEYEKPNNKNTNEETEIENKDLYIEVLKMTAFSLQENLNRISELLKNDNIAIQNKENEFVIYKDKAIYISLDKLYNVLTEEKHRLGNPVVEQYVDNVKIKIKKMI